MDDNSKPLILGSPGIDSVGVWRMQNSARAKIAHKFYSLATGIKNAAGAFVGFALNEREIDELLSFQEVRGKEIARTFFKQFGRSTGSNDVGSFILVGIELDTFLDLLAGLSVKGYTGSKDKVTPFAIEPAKNYNKKEEGRRW